MGNILPKTIQETSMEVFADRFAKMLGVDNIPIVWNQNPKRVATESGNKPTSYPIMYINVVSVARNEHTPFKRQSNVYQLGYVAADGTRKGVQLTPVQIGLRFLLKTDDYRQAFAWATDLVIDANSHSSNSILSFVLRSDALGEKFNIPTQGIITSNEYPITEVEHTEDVMEYSIEGDIMLYTRANRGEFEPTMLATYGVLAQTDPDRAVANLDGTTDPLFRSTDGNTTYPVRLRSNLDDLP